MKVLCHEFENYRIFNLVTILGLGHEFEIKVLCHEFANYRIR